MFWRAKKVGGIVGHNSPSSVKKQYNAGVGFLQSGNIEGAIKEFSALVKFEHPSAIYNLALLYTEGHGPHLMLPEAAELMGKASRLGHSSAAQYYALYTQFMGFDLRSEVELTTLLEHTGNGNTPLILINSLGSGLLKRINNRDSALIFVANELKFLTSQVPMDSVDVNNFPFNFTKYALGIGIQEVRGLNPSYEDLFIANECNRDLADIMDICSRQLGMNKMIANFVRASVLGTISMAYELTETSRMPSVEFYL